MSVQEHTSTVALAAILTVLIWLWAEGENREAQTIVSTIRFVDSSDAGRFLIRIEDPSNNLRLVSQIDVRMDIEGPNLSLRRVRNSSFRIPLDNLEDATRRTIILADVLRELDLMVQTGVAVSSVTPNRVTVVIDELEQRMVPISTELPGVVADQITMEPKEIAVTMPRSSWEDVERRLGERIVFLDIDPVALETLQPGSEFSAQDVGVRLAAELADEPTVTLEAVPVSVEFTVQRNLQEREAAVPVKVTLPTRDIGRYDVIVDGEYELIRGVIISGNTATMAKFEAREIKVFATINLSSDELEQGITRKRIEWMLPNGLQARMKSGAPPPEIPIRIVPRASENS